MTCNGDASSLKVSLWSESRRVPELYRQRSAAQSLVLDKPNDKLTDPLGTDHVVGRFEESSCEAPCTHRLVFKGMPGDERLGSYLTLEFDFSHDLDRALARAVVSRVELSAIGPSAD